MDYPPIKVDPLDPNGTNSSPTPSEEEIDSKTSKNDLPRRYYEVYFTCFVGTYHTTKFNLLEGDFVIVQADRGHDVGVVSRLVEFEVSLVDQDHEIVSVVPKDEFPVRVMLQDKVIAQNQALDICRNKCVELLISTHIEVIATEFQFDRKKLTLYYKKHSDVSVCKLIRKLYNIFKMRIWMEPIDVELCNDSFSNITTKFLSLSQITIPPQDKNAEFLIPPPSPPLSSSPVSLNSTSNNIDTINNTSNSPTNIIMNHNNNNNVNNGNNIASISIPSSTTTTSSNVSTSGNSSPVSAPFAPATPPTPHFTQKKNEISTPVEKYKKSLIEPRRDMSTVENNILYPNYAQLSQHQNVTNTTQRHLHQSVPQTTNTTATTATLSTPNVGLQTSLTHHHQHHHPQQQQQQLSGTSAQYYRSTNNTPDQMQYQSRYTSKGIQERMNPRPLNQSVRSQNYSQQRQTPSINYSRDQSLPSSQSASSYNNYYEGQHHHRQQNNNNHNHNYQQHQTLSYQDYDTYFRHQQNIPLSRQEYVERYVEMIDDRFNQNSNQKNNYDDYYHYSLNKNNSNINGYGNGNVAHNNNAPINHHSQNYQHQHHHHHHQQQQSHTQKYQENNYNNRAISPNLPSIHDDVGRYLTVDFLEDDIFTSTSLEPSSDYYNFMPQSSSSIYYPTHG